MTDDLQTALALEARQMVFDRRHRVLGLDHHTDRGSQLTAAAYQAVLGAYDITGSMSRAGICCDHALAERFMATLKGKLIDRQP